MQPTQSNMHRISIDSTKTTPSVVFDADSGVLTLSGVSIPENVSEFFAPMLEWLQDYVKDPAEHTVIRFDFDYFNTASSKIFMEIITELESMADADKKCTIEWYYDADDPDMREAGEDYALITRIPCHFVQGSLSATTV